LIDLPENPVGKVLEILRAVYPEFTGIDLPEVIDFAEARKTVGAMRSISSRASCMILATTAFCDTA
jgi:hypothetical protein